MVNISENIKFGGMEHGYPKNHPKDSLLNNLPPMQKLLRIGTFHGCPNPIGVAIEYGLYLIKTEGKPILQAFEEAQNWLIERQLDCNRQTEKIFATAKELNRPLYELLCQPVKRNPDEKVGKFDKRFVGKDYKKFMPPTSTPTLYGSARALIEQMGRGDARSPHRVDEAKKITRKAIKQSKTPNELLANIAGLVVPKEYGGEGVANPLEVLKHVMSVTSLKEQRCLSIFKDIARQLKEKHPKLYKFYMSLDEEALKNADIISPKKLALKR